MRGGKRPGAGRKPGSTKVDAMDETIAFRCTVSERQTIEILGNGNISEGLRKAIRIAKALNGWEVRWISADNPPQGEPHTWTEDVIVVTDFGRVCMSAYMHGQDEHTGSWARGAEWRKGERATWWIEPPIRYAHTDI